MGTTPVLVLPMGHIVEQGREYIARGWCFLEFCLALSFGNIANMEIHNPVKRLRDEVSRLQGDTVEGFTEAFRGRHFTQSGDIANMEIHNPVKRLCDEVSRLQGDTVD